MKKILFIGDSSILPRQEVPYNDTYSTLVKSRLKNKYEVETSGKVKNTSQEISVNFNAFTLYGYQPDIVVLDYGIVDVFPRPYPKKVYKLFGCLGILRIIDNFLKGTGLYYKLGDLFKFKEVKLGKFKFYSENIIEKLINSGVDKIIIVGIIKPYKVLKKSKIIDQEVNEYNKVYTDIAEKSSKIIYIDIYGESNEDFTIWDGYHYSKKASKYLAQKIVNLIEND